LEQKKIQQEQIAALQVIIAEGRGGRAAGLNVEVAKPPVFNGEGEKVGDFITACRLYLRMKIRGIIVEEQIQGVLSYVQEGLVDVWKENFLEDLESGKVEFRSTEKFLLKLKKKFSGGDEKLVKVAELKKVE